MNENDDDNELMTVEKMMLFVFVVFMSGLLTEILRYRASLEDFDRGERQTDKHTGFVTSGNHYPRGVLASKGYLSNLLCVCCDSSAFRSFSFSLPPSGLCVRYLEKKKKGTTTLQTNNGDDDATADGSKGSKGSSTSTKCEAMGKHCCWCWQE